MINLKPILLAIAFTTVGTGQIAFAKNYNRQALNQVVERVEESISAGHQPIVILDLDDTLINTRERNLRILKEFARQPEIQTAHPAAALKIQNLRMSDIRYQSSDTLKAIGVDHEDVLKKASDFWLTRFFTNAYCALDRANPGATKYLHRLVRAGAMVVYLTGRDVPRMHDGTLESLGRNMFPTNSDHALLMMKPDAKMDDLQFKKDSFAQIEKMGEVVGLFENEPANLNAMAEAFPDAEAIFLDTIHSPKPDVPTDRAEWVPDFKKRQQSI